MLTDQEVSDNSGWLVLLRVNGSNTSWTPIVSLGTKEGAFARAEAEAKHRPDSELAVGTLRALVRGVVTVEIVGGD